MSDDAGVDRHAVTLGWFLLFLVLVQFGYPVTLLGPAWAALYLAAYVGAALTAFRVVRGTRRRTAPVVVTGAALILSSAWVLLGDRDGIALVVSLSSLALFLVCVMSALLRFVYVRGRTHELDLVLAAVCVYLLLGGFFGALHGVLETLVPGTYFDQAHPDAPVPWQQLVYFSYVTLATLGYGDIVAVSSWGRALSALQAVLGTLFITTVIGRLVGAYVGRRPHPPDRDVP
ncbi:potassium channel family protein [Nocardiopsis sp. MG754419]|uniref:potassium channel family protein n=1 Tax=Nocardiopsis sp. MG754419 TaxID=2259865 RepID=UPI001BA5F7AE|nr:potassium channel family protein [Nocardiopsis sp. MG754419]MBR8741747.1 two pore domain potassium channel family protein [Nocardiopsis sp. MG754419]